MKRLRLADVFPWLVTAKSVYVDGHSFSVRFAPEWGLTNWSPLNVDVADEETTTSVCTVLQFLFQRDRTALHWGWIAVSIAHWVVLIDELQNKGRRIGPRFEISDKENCSRMKVRKKERREENNTCGQSKAQASGKRFDRSFETHDATPSRRLLSLPLISFNLFYSV